MGHRCEFYGNLTLRNNKLVYEVTARWKHKEELVYEEHEDGTNYCRYIYKSYCSGYLVVFPNERLGYYYGYEDQKELELSECGRLNINIYWCNPVDDLKQIEKQRPELKYLIKKFDGNATQFIDLVNKYKKDKSIESLVGIKLNNVALDKRLERLSKAKRLEVINFIKNNKCDSSVNLSTILFAIKHKLTLEKAKLYISFHYNFKLANYIEKYKIDLFEYKDYIYMCKATNKDLKDDYWLYPKNFNERHHLVMQQLNRLREVERLESEKKAEEELIKTINNVKLIANKLSPNNKTINNYYIYIPETIEDISKQAEVLNQCLILCNYPAKVANKKSILVFIRKEDKPIATAEIDYNKKLLQFYGDEKNRSNCKPDEEVTNVFNQWLSSANI